MNFGNTHRWRIAPGILFLFYIFVYSFSKSRSIQSIPFYKPCFVSIRCVNSFQNHSRIRPYISIKSDPEHTHGNPHLNALFKSNLFNFHNKNKNDRSLISKFWSSVKSYLNGKFSAIKTNKVLKRSSRIGLSDSFKRGSDLKQLSFFDFFDKASVTLGDYKIQNDFNESMSRESPYMKLVRTGPSGIIKRFLKIAPAMVKDAISLTVSTLIGSFYRYSAETTIMTTTDRLASLILNLQVTGYIYCNAEQRYQLSSLCGHEDNESDSARIDPEVSVCDQLDSLTVGDELVSYVRRLPRSYINSIFDNMNPEILYAMRHSTEKAIQLLTMVNINYPNLKEDQKYIIQQTGSFAMQLCFWKLALGYCMRDQETKIELTKSLNLK